MMNIDKKTMHKLVRDNIPEIISKSGKLADFFVAEDAEYWPLLKEKLLEEVHEFLESETTEELGDILEVIEAICTYKNISSIELKQTKEKKFSERGGFSKKYILKPSQEERQWNKNFISHPEALPLGV
jgi:predicted house-cleaning noncanonical NTP pyrophosphatase (MazG superfamily)